MNIELCDNLDNKIIETINFIVIKIIVFYYRDNSKFLGITAYYTKTNTLVPGAIMEQDMHICHCVICCYDSYCYQYIQDLGFPCIDKTTDH